MASSDPEIKDGFTLPTWMKTKPVKEYEPFASSPPAPEDSFFYIRYPKPEVLFGKPKFDAAGPKVFAEPSNEVKAPSAYNVVKEKDWSKHTKPCQDVLHGIAPINTAVKSASSKPKPAGTDDGFKGEGAACGTSIVKVAHQIISSKSSRGFTVASPEEEHAVAPEMHQYNLMHRRGSKSLPATPAHSPPSSPTSRRKMNGNRFFTSPYEPVDDPNTPRSWLSMALLGLKKELATSTSTLAEEENHETLAISRGSLVESVENLGPSPKSKILHNLSQEPSAQQAKPVKPQTFRPKPSELREMNFWSPTSM
ncbi:uncharacterized protein LOC113497876 isoform X1 [Trichoplusia ni]|uniref:Uncharacterized protein LOC113497876 isoform X1 n=1 Tax=Trichoplusia ni TaxID=7111 RepID=A0A7E5VYR5_TRINI|nr:uncharacterized protein LOC113497876 isoform X1 [Trichoplusia ni]